MGEIARGHGAPDEQPVPGRGAQSFPTEERRAKTKRTEGQDGEED